MNIKNATTALTLLCLALLPVGQAKAALELNKGDSVIVVGNTFAERIALSGYLDSMIQAANPGKNIVVRSVPNSADEVDDRPRETKVPPMDFYLKRHKANVVVMCYGMSESFDGLGGIEKFKTDLTARVDHHLNAKYSGAAPKIVLVSPIAHEDLGAPLPTGDAVKQRNVVLKAYAEAMKQVADAKGAVYIDLFNPSLKSYTSVKTKHTNNGIAPNEYGCFVFTGMMAYDLGWWDGKTDAGNQDKVTKLRQVAYDKHYQFRLRYRATNTEYVWGRRHKPFGVVNFPPELDHWDKMTVAREKAMWQMDKPSLGQLFAKAPSGTAVWESVPMTYNYPGDKYAGVEIPFKDIKKDKKAGDASAIADPEEYLKSFQVAEGYQANLFASEDMFKDENGVGLLANPLAMTFDYQGRLWVLCAPTYPHPYPGKVTDCRVIILDDTNNDGVADKCTVYARNLNIPTCFVIDANGVAYIGQAPDLWKFTDTDGDDVADKKEMVYSGFGMCDSHHSISAAVWDPHGGILMLEGVFTRTNIETPYGTHRTRDAAVWRYDPRTQKLIAIAHTGHPNPWGQTFDQYGQSILMDTSGQAHYNFSSLISPYIFPEKPKKGPSVMNRGRPNSGADFVYTSHFPDDVQGTYVHSQCIGFLGTHWTKLSQDGANNSGYKGEAMPAPILSSKIGNYRPVCSEFGADGALYIADWVNPLIGHMQFNLRDPRRDHTHGRIYRVSHKERPLVKKLDLTKMSANELLDTFKLPEQNTRDRARRLLQNMDPAKTAKAAEDWLFKQNPREGWYERASLEVLWVQQGLGKLNMKVVDEAMRAREPLVQAGAIRALRMGLQFGDLSTKDCLPFIAQAVNNRDMRVRLEAVMACAYLDAPNAADLANQVTQQNMDGVIRNAHGQAIKYLKAKGITSVAELPKFYRMPEDEVLALKKKNPSDALIAKAVLARPELPIAARREALASVGDTPEKQAVALMQLTKIQIFDPARTAKAITPFLQELPNAAVFAISSDLDALLDSSEPALRSTAVALKVRTGSPLPSLAERDPVALLSAIESLPKELAPDNVPGDMLVLAETGKIESGMAFQQATRLSNDAASLFKRFATLVDKAQEIDYSNWGEEHQLAMAALGAMHQIEEADWPVGFDSYKIARADPEVLKLGHEVYHEAETGCVKCHGDKGQGAGGFPALLGSPNLLGSPMRPATIVKYGLMGELPHTLNPADGKPFNAQMEPLSNLSDDHMAAAITYARQSWGNFAEPVTIEHMVAAKKPPKDPATGTSYNMWPAEALLDKFPFERDRILGSAPPPTWSIIKWKAPGAGLWMMLAAVTVSMLLILGVTCLGGRAPDDVSHSAPALA